MCRLKSLRIHYVSHSTSLKPLLNTGCSWWSATGVAVSVGVPHVTSYQDLVSPCHLFKRLPVVVNVFKISFELQNLFFK